MSANNSRPKAKSKQYSSNRHLPASLKVLAQDPQQNMLTIIRTRIMELVCGRIISFGSGKVRVQRWAIPGQPWNPGNLGPERGAAAGPGTGAATAAVVARSTRAAASPNSS